MHGFYWQYEFNYGVGDLCIYSAALPHSERSAARIDI